jgi:general secretion pathway protein D
VVGNKQGIEKIRGLVKRLDFKLNPDDSGGAYVYYVKHGEAEKIADILNGIAKSLKDDQQKQGGVPSNIPPPPSFGDGFGGTPIGLPQTGSTSTGLFGADVKISADKDTNSLIIVGSKQDYQSVVNLLKKIDIPRDQVYVETIIMEMSVEDTNNFGISYYRFVDGTEGLARVGFGGGNIGTLTNIGSEGAILGFGSGDTVKVRLGDREVNVKSMLGFLNLIKQNTKTDILATPQVIAMDNEEATVEVGEEVPVGLNTTPVQGAGATQSIERVKATIKLVIKPFISPSSETVRMNIKQTIKQISNKIPEGAADLAKISRSTVDRAIETNIVVRDGDTAVLGGLMRDEESTQTSKVPLLGDIPVLGWLFKSSAKKVEKRNLLVFITPRVLRTPDDSKRLLGKKMDERVNYIKDSFGGKDRHGSKFEALRPKTTEDAPLQDNFNQE